MKNSPTAFGTEDSPDHAAVLIATMAPDAGKDVSEQGMEEEDHAKRRRDHTSGSAGGFEDEDDRNRASDHVAVVGLNPTQ